MLYTDIRELKSVLEIDPRNTAEDKKLTFFLEQASQWIEELLNRPGLTYKQRTRFYKGTGTQKLLLQDRPVFTFPSQPNFGITVLFDDQAFFGSEVGAFTETDASLVYGQDFCLDIDQEDGLSSRCGILVRINDFWRKPTIRQEGYLSPFVSEDFGSYKITTTAGYTVDTLPAVFRWATNTIVAKFRSFFPLGVELGSESFQERSVSALPQVKGFFFETVKPMLWMYRNWKW